MGMRLHRGNERGIAFATSRTLYQPVRRLFITKAAAVMTRSILIVEDNEVARKQLQQVLQTDPDLHVEAIGDGMRALEELLKNSYSIAITDLRMPRLDGMQLIKEIQQRRLPVTVIVTTGHGTIDEAVQAIRMGAY